MLYLIHFDRPYRHARHYLGYTRSKKTLPQRIEHHREGSGARLMAAVARAKIPFEVVRTWPDGDRSAERRLKNQKHGPRLCPVCGAAQVQARRRAA
jgi:predicted GIY-YIG superfamily endonuclease